MSLLYTFFLNPTLLCLAPPFIFIDGLSIPFGRLDVIVESLALRKSLVIDGQSIGRGKAEKELDPHRPYGNQQSSGYEVGGTCKD